MIDVIIKTYHMIQTKYTDKKNFNPIRYKNTHTFKCITKSPTSIIT